MECQLVQVAGLFDSTPNDNLIISPLGVVPKEETGKFRLIHHLSYPKVTSVNDCMAEGSCFVSNASFNNAVALVCQAGPHAQLAKADLESVFMLIPVHHTSFHLLGMQWCDHFYFNKCMPMGCSVSCLYFEAFSSFLEWPLKTKDPPGSAMHYLDDFLLVGKVGTHECQETLIAFQEVCSELGVLLAPKKIQGPPMPSHSWA